jgi:CRISPR-associated protein Csm2
MPQAHHQDRTQQNRQAQPADTTGWLNRIDFNAPVDPDLFNTIAKESAHRVAQTDKNKPTQLRRFYDELLLWEMRVSQHPAESKAAKFAECLPFIRMLNAKAAYAEGRKLVDRTFVDLMHHTLGKVACPETLTTCKYFWEAFMGFYKQERQD